MANESRPGPTGRSAYEIALLHGFRGSQADWLQSLVGRRGDSIKGDRGEPGGKGDRGDRGMRGPQGESIKGDKGDPGNNGREIEVFRVPLFFDVIRDDESLPLRLIPTYGQGKSRPDLIPVRDADGLMTRIDCV